MKRVLVIDGGGAKGFAAASALVEIEAKTGTRLCDLFDLVVGSSVGAILGATIASGRYTMPEILAQMHQIVPKMFTRQWLPPFPKYSRKPFVDFWLDKYENIKMSDCRTKFFCTSVDMVTGNTHYFKSWEKKDGELPLLTAILRSFAAPVFFGSLPDEKDQRVWIDGGAGDENCPLMEAVIESLRQKWLGADRVHILSLGNGSTGHTMRFDKAKRCGTLRQALFFLDPYDGGLGRRQSIGNAVGMATELGGMVPQYTFQRIDATISRQLDKLDGKEFIDRYVMIGRQMSEVVDYNLITG